VKNPVIARRPRAARVVALAALVAMLAVAAGVFARPSGARAEWGATVAADAANIRAEPGTWSDVVGQAWQDEWVTILSGPTDSGWYEVSAPGGDGWIDGSLLALDGAGAWQGWGGESLAAPGERWIDVDRSDGTVTLYEGDIPQATFWAAMGIDPSADGFYSTAIGTYRVYERDADLTWSEFGGAWFTHWVGFDPDRLNGFHSWVMDENGWLIDGAAGPTYGCVALEPSAAEQLFWFAEPGTRVEVHW